MMRFTSELPPPPIKNRVPQDLGRGPEGPLMGMDASLRVAEIESRNLSIFHAAMLPCCHAAMLPCCQASEIDA